VIEFHPQSVKCLVITYHPQSVKYLVITYHPQSVKYLVITCHPQSVKYLVCDRISSAFRKVSCDHISSAVSKIYCDHMSSTVSKVSCDHISSAVSKISCLWWHRPLSGLDQPIVDVSKSHNRHFTLGRAPLDQRPLYPTAHNIDKSQTFMRPVGSVISIRATLQPQTYSFDRAATGIGVWKWYLLAVCSPKNLHIREIDSGCGVTDSIVFLAEYVVPLVTVWRNKSYLRYCSVAPYELQN